MRPVNIEELDETDVVVGDAATITSCGLRRSAGGELGEWCCRCQVENSYSNEENELSE